MTAPPLSRSACFSPPTISLAAGSYTGTQSVTISGPAGSTIRYSLDGTPPTSHAAVYPGAIPIAATATLKAVALRLGWVNSPVTAAAYIIGAVQAAAPTFAPAAGAYSSVQSVALASATAGSTIFYTTDGSTPTTASPVYSTPIAVSASTTIKAIATASGFTTSAVASAAYTINGAAATPTFAPAAGSYSAAQSVAISSATAGASIYYTTDGSTPTTASTAYSSPISVAASETIKAIAVAAGYSNSAVGSAAYTITIPAGPTTTIVTWTAMTAASQSGNYLLNANATPSGGRAVQTIDATQAFRVTVENTGANSEGVVTYLDTTTGTDYNWSSSHSYLAGAFHYNGGLLRTTVGGASSGLGAIALPDLVSFVKSGNDVVLQTSADNGATWATVSTFTGVLAGQGTIYVKSLFAIGGTTKQIKISITV